MSRPKRCPVKSINAGIRFITLLVTGPRNATTDETHYRPSALVTPSINPRLYPSKNPSSPSLGSGGIPTSGGRENSPRTYRQPSQKPFSKPRSKSPPANATRGRQVRVMSSVFLMRPMPIPWPCFRESFPTSIRTQNTSIPVRTGSSRQPAEFRHAVEIRSNPHGSFCGSFRSVPCTICFHSSSVNGAGLQP